MNLRDKRVCVTGGAGFLGSHVVNRLWAMGCSKVFIPRIQDYDLRQREDAVRMYHHAQPDVVIHLAALVGGIGANRALPGKFFYDNAIMGMQLMDVGQQFGIQKFVQMGSACEYPRGQQRSLRNSQTRPSGSGPSVSRAIRHERHSHPVHEPVRARRQF